MNPGVAAAQCSAQPLVGCKQTSVAEKALLLLKNKGGAADKLTWKWTKGEETLPGDLGDPLGSTGYTLCIYDSDGGPPELVSAATVAGGGICDGEPCWAPTGAGFKFKDKAGASGGITKILLKAGEAGKAKIIIKGKGEPLDMPILPLVQDPQVVAQLSNSDGVCWEARFSPPAIKNETELFKDKGDPPVATPTQTVPATQTVTLTGTVTATPTHTGTATASGTATVTGTATNTHTATATVANTATPTDTPTAGPPTPTGTATQISSATATLTPSITATLTATATATASSTATPTNTATGGVPTATSTASATRTQTATFTPTMVGAVCGNNVLEPGETCAACPADCTVLPCTAVGPTIPFTMTLVPPPGQAPTGATVRLGYHSGRLSIPGTGTAASVLARVTAPPPPPNPFIRNDQNYALTVVLGRPTPIDVLFTVTFDRCQGAPAPTVADLGCSIEGCASGGPPIAGCSCTVSQP